MWEEFSDKEDLIRRQDMIESILFATADGDKADWVISVIKSVPSAQKTGKWFTNIKKGTITCQVCKEEISYYPSIGIRPIWEYCPYCGSYNGGEQDD